jgi:hypothetical protein
VIALASGLALLIGWRYGFSRRSLELASATFAVVLALQTIGLVLSGGEATGSYWAIVAVIAAAWVACVFVGDRARRLLRG